MAKKKLTRPKHRGALVVYGDWLRALDGDAHACLILARVMDKCMDGPYRASSRTIAKDLGMTTQQVSQRLHLLRESPFQISVADDPQVPGDHVFTLNA